VPPARPRRPPPTAPTLPDSHSPSKPAHRTDEARRRTRPTGPSPQPQHGLHRRPARSGRDRRSDAPPRADTLPTQSPPDSPIIHLHRAARAHVRKQASPRRPPSPAQPTVTRRAILLDFSRSDLLQYLAPPASVSETAAWCEHAVERLRIRCHRCDGNRRRSARSGSPRARGRGLALSWRRWLAHLHPNSCLSLTATRRGSGGTSPWIGFRCDRLSCRSRATRGSGVGAGRGARRSSRRRCKIRWSGERSPSLPRRCTSGCVDRHPVHLPCAAGERRCSATSSECPLAPRPTA
jgi:hypothetical protein